MVIIIKNSQLEDGIIEQSEDWLPLPNCSKLTTSSINILLKFQILISEICQYFLLKKSEKILHCTSFSHFFQQKISV